MIFFVIIFNYVSKEVKLAIQMLNMKIRLVRSFIFILNFCSVK